MTVPPLTGPRSGTRAGARAVVGTIRTDGTAVAATLPPPAVRRQGLPVSARTTRDRCLGKYPADVATGLGRDRAWPGRGRAAVRG